MWFKCAALSGEIDPMLPFQGVGQTGVMGGLRTAHFS